MTTLKYGDRGQAVTDFQDGLRIALGGVPIAVDGIYGSVTEQYVQKAYDAFRIPGVSGAVTDALHAAVMAKALGPAKKTNVFESTPSGVKTPNTPMSSSTKAALALAISGIIFLGLKGAGVLK